MKYIEDFVLNCIHFLIYVGFLWCDHGDVFSRASCAHSSSMEAFYVRWQCGMRIERCIKAGCSAGCALLTFDLS